MVWLRDLGYKQYEIATALQLDSSRVREIFRYGNNEGSALVRIDKAPVTIEELPAEIQPMMEFTGRGFKLFYEWATGQALPDHCWQWVQEFCDHRNLMLNVPPRHMKSTIFSLWVPIWLLCRNRDEQIILVSKSGDLAIRWASDIANQLEFNRLLVETFGRFAPERKGDSPWQPGRGKLLIVGRQRVARGMQMSVLARGSKQQIFGMEATVVIADDPTDAGVAQSETENVRQMEWFREQVLSRIETQSMGEASGRAVIIGQRVHYRDMYGQISAQKYERGPKIGQQLWKVITHPAVIRWPDEDPEDPTPLVLWPEKWTFEELMLSYERVGGHRPFETLYQQNPLPDDAKLVRPEWWEGCRDHERPGGRGIKGNAGDFLPISRVMSLDPSPRAYNGLIIADTVFDREHFACAIIEADRFVGNLHDIKQRILDDIAKYRPDYFILERSTVTGWAEGDPFFNEVKRRTRFIPHHTGRNKLDQDLGLESLAGDVEHGNIRLPYGDSWGREMSGMLEHEMNVWPFGDTWDIMMALWFIKNNYKRLKPPKALAGHFTGTKSQGWGYLQQATTQEQLVKDYRRMKREQAKG